MANRPSCHHSLLWEWPASSCVNCCFTPSLPVRLYQGDREWTELSVDVKQHESKDRAVTIHSWWEWTELSLFTLGRSGQSCHYSFLVGVARAVTIHSWWEWPELSLFTLGDVAHFLPTHSLLKSSPLSDSSGPRNLCSSPAEAFFTL